jgi:hypothetical protein
MDLNQSVLITERSFAQSYYLFLSSLAGSVLGVIGVVGFFMRLCEWIYLKIRGYIYKKIEKLVRRLKRKQARYCFENRINLEDQKKKIRYDFINNMTDSGLISSQNVVYPDSITIMLNSQESILDTPCNSLVSEKLNMDSEMSPSLIVDDTHIQAKYKDHKDRDIIPSSRTRRIVPIS